MKRISHIKITKHLGALRLVQRVLGVGNGIMVSNHEVINLTIITTEIHIGRVQDRAGLTKEVGCVSLDFVCVCVYVWVYGCVFLSVQSRQDPGQDLS